MVLKRWRNGGRINQPMPKTSSLSLTSPKGTAVVRKKNGSFATFLRRAKHNEDFVALVMAMAIVLSMAIIFIVASSSISSGSMRKGPTPHPRGHRYFDYWQDEDHKDFEPYPWRLMKRPKNEASGKKLPFMASSIYHRRNEHYPVSMDDESYLPSPTFIDEKEEEWMAFNDRSLFYTELRNSYESYFPPPKSTTSGEYDPNAERALQAVQDLQTYTDLQTYLPKSNPDPSGNKSKQNTLFYDIHDCPESPPDGYPVEWNLVHEVLSQWPADDPELPASGQLHQGLCVFDLQKDYDANLRKALNYRNAEVPFVVRGDPIVAQTVERWNAPHYLSTLIGEAPQGSETSSSATFTYWTASGVDKHKYKDFKPPTEINEMTFEEWLELANVTDSRLLSPESPHYYFKVAGCAPGKLPRNSEEAEASSPDQSCSMLPGKAPHVPYLADELPFFAQTKSSLYVKEPLSETSMGKFQTSKGLYCRFGMKGILSTNHFDGERNFVTVLSGERRYVLAHPKQCGNMALFPYGHPSARHSAVDWAHPDLAKFPAFEHATGNEVVLQAGDSLFLPSLWFHYIVSMSMNVQCNTRSGMDERNVQALDDSCGW